MSRKLKRSVPFTIQCPCCDYFTFRECASNEVCPVCYWTNDGRELEVGELRSDSTANDGLTIELARERFVDNGASDSKWKNKVCSLYERHGYRFGCRRKQFLFYLFLCDLGHAGIPIAETTLCPQCEWDAPLGAFRKLPGAEGVVAYSMGFGLWSASLPEVTANFQSVVLRTATNRCVKLENRSLEWQTVFQIDFTVTRYNVSIDLSKRIL